LKIAPQYGENRGDILLKLNAGRKVFAPVGKKGQKEFRWVNALASEEKIFNR